MSHLVTRCTIANAPKARANETSFWDTAFGFKRPCEVGESNACEHNTIPGAERPLSTVATNQDTHPTAQQQYRERSDRSQQWRPLKTRIQPHNYSTGSGATDLNCGDHSRHVSKPHNYNTGSGASQQWQPLKTRIQPPQLQYWERSNRSQG